MIKKSKFIALTLALAMIFALIPAFTVSAISDSNILTIDYSDPNKTFEQYVLDANIKLPYDENDDTTSDIWRLIIRGSKSLTFEDCRYIVENFTRITTLNLFDATFANKKIPNGAFAEFSNIVTLALPNSVTEIGKNAFAGCVALKYITYGANNKTIGDSAFSSCYSLTEVVLPEQLTSIGALAYGLSSQTKVVLALARNAATYNANQTAFSGYTDKVTLITSAGAKGYDTGAFAPSVFKNRAEWSFDITGEYPLATTGATVKLHTRVKNALGKAATVKWYRDGNEIFSPGTPSGDTLTITNISPEYSGRYVSEITLDGFTFSFGLTLSVVSTGPHTGEVKLTMADESPTVQVPPATTPDIKPVEPGLPVYDSDDLPISVTTDGKSASFRLSDILTTSKNAYASDYEFHYNAASFGRLSIKIPSKTLRYGFSYFDPAGAITFNLPEDVTISIPFRSYRDHDSNADGSLVVILQALSSEETAKLAEDASSPATTLVYYGVFYRLSAYYLDKNGAKTGVKYENFPITMSPGDSKNIFGVKATEKDGKYTVRRLSAGEESKNYREEGTIIGRAFMQVNFLDLKNKSATDPMYKYILAAAEKLLMGGYENLEFRENAKMTRAEFAKTLAVLFDVRETASLEKYADIKPDAWYYEVLSKLAAVGGDKFIQDASFKPNQPVTREEMAYMAAAYLNYGKSAPNINSIADGTFTDISDVDAIYQTPIAQLYAEGVLEGYDKKLRPHDTLTRAEAAALLSRLWLVTRR